MGFDSSESKNGQQARPGKKEIVSMARWRKTRRVFYLSWRYFTTVIVGILCFWFYFTRPKEWREDLLEPARSKPDGG